MIRQCELKRCSWIGPLVLWTKVNSDNSVSASRVNFETGLYRVNIFCLHNVREDQSPASIVLK